MICSTIQIECTLFLNYLIILIYAYNALKQHTRKRLVCKWWWKCQKHMIVWKYQRWWHTLLKISYKKETIETILKINFRLVILKINFRLVTFIPDLWVCTGLDSKEIFDTECLCYKCQASTSSYTRTIKLVGSDEQG